MIETARPFIKRFKTKNSYYIYDVNTNRIILVSSALYARLPRAKNDADLISSKEKEQNSQDILRPYSEIIEKYNLFSPSRPKARGFFAPPDESQLREHYELAGTEQLVLEMSQQCNLRCKYCIYSGKYRYQRPHISHFMSLNTAKKAVDFYIDRYKGGTIVKSPNIGFYGGEPLMNMDVIIDCIKYVRQRERDINKKIGMRICTNATLLNKGNISPFVDNEIDLQISIDGPEKEHDRNRIYRNGRGTFNKIIEFLEYVYAKYPIYYRQHLVFNCTVTPGSSLLELNNFFMNNQLVNQNIRLIGNLNTLDTSYLEECEYNYNQAYELKSLAKLYYESAHSAGRKKITFIDKEINKIYASLYKRPIYESGYDLFPIKGPCEAGIRKLFVTWDGTFYPCEKINPSFSIGSLSKGFEHGRIREFWIGFVKLLNDKECLTCWAVRHCTNCFVTLGKDGYFSFSNKKEFCRTVKSNLIMAFKAFSALLENKPPIEEDWKNTLIV